MLTPLSCEFGKDESWGVVVVGQTSVTPSAAARAWNRQRHYSLNFVVAGQGALVAANGERVPVTAGCLYQHFPSRDAGRQRLSWSGKAPVKEWFLTLDGRLHKRLAATGLFPSAAVFRSAHPDPAGVLAALQQQLAPLPEIGFVRRLPAALGATLAALGQLLDCARPHERVERATRAAQRARRWIEQNPGRRTPLPALAREIGVSYTTLARAFRAEFGESLGRYRIRCRIEEAKRRLLHAPVAVAAAELGYGDPFTFSSQFSRAVGMSPRAYQRAAGSANSGSTISTPGQRSR